MAEDEKNQAITWIYTKDELPPINKITRCLVSITNDDNIWTAVDIYHGYTGTFENAHFPKSSTRVYAWSYLPEPAPLVK